MKITDYDNVTDDYNDSLSKNYICTLNEKLIDKVIPTFLLAIPCGLSS